MRRRNPMKAVKLFNGSGAAAGLGSVQVEHAAIADAVAPYADAAGSGLQVGQGIGNEQAQVFQRGLAQAGDFVEKAVVQRVAQGLQARAQDRKSTRLNSSHLVISYAVFC